MPNEMNISTAIRKAPEPPPPELVWRGLKVEPRAFKDTGIQEKGVMIRDLTDGDVVSLRGFQSTSVAPQTGARFAGQGGGRYGTVMEIRPKRGMYLETITTVEGENEFLLPHNAKYRFLGRKKIKIRTNDPYAGRVETMDVEVVQLEML